MIEKIFSELTEAYNVSGGMLNLLYFKRFDAADHMIGRSVDHVESDASPLRSSLANNKTCRTCHCHMKWTLKKKDCCNEKYRMSNIWLESHIMPRKC